MNSKDMLAAVPKTTNAPGKTLMGEDVVRARKVKRAGAIDYGKIKIK